MALYFRAAPRPNCRRPAESTARAANCNQQSTACQCRRQVFRTRKARSLRGVHPGGASLTEALCKAVVSAPHSARTLGWMKRTLSLTDQEQWMKNLTGVLRRLEALLSAG